MPKEPKAESRAVIALNNLKGAIAKGFSRRLEERSCMCQMLREANCVIFEMISLLLLVTGAARGTLLSANGVTLLLMLLLLRGRLLALHRGPPSLLCANSGIFSGGGSAGVISKEAAWRPRWPLCGRPQAGLVAL